MSNKIDILRTYLKYKNMHFKDRAALEQYQAKTIKKLCKKYGVLYTVIPNKNKEAEREELLFHSEATPRINLVLQKLKDPTKAEFMSMDKFVENTDEELRKMAWYVGFSYAALAWHHFYGIGCGKNVNEAKRLIKLACKDDGHYEYRSYKKLIKDMGLESELKYVNHYDE